MDSQGRGYKDTNSEGIKTTLVRKATRKRPEMQRKIEERK